MLEAIEALEHNIETMTASYEAAQHVLCCPEERERYGLSTIEDVRSRARTLKARLSELEDKLMVLQNFDKPFLSFVA